MFVRYEINTIFIIKDVGVTTAKKIIPITIGEIILPRNKPNLNHIKLRGFSNLEFSKPKIKKIIDITNDQYLISLPLING